MEDLDALLEELERSSLGESNEDPEPLRGPRKDGKVAEAAKASLLQDDTRPMPAQVIYTTKIEEINVYSDIQEPETERPPQSMPQSPPQSTPQNTSAAAQLDELMAHLCQMQSKVMAKPAGPREPLPKKDTNNSLDSMLGGLEQDLQNLGIATTPKGHCASCQKPIAGKVITALGKTWHPEHFVCAHCATELGCGSPFFERGGRAYCSRDYHELFSPRCAYCAAPILDKVLTAMDQTWHPEHFFCARCGEVFRQEGFHEKDKKPYCRKDYLAMFAPKCGGCNRPVLENYLTAMDAVWHPECFVCRDCFQAFSTASFFELNGQPFCELHYHRRRGTICYGCEQPISGRCISAMGRKFHPEHFVCAFCLSQLSKGIFREQNDKAYCQPCFTRLFPL